MIKVITYGSYDMLHYGHIRLLERAKQLGDYLIVGVTSDDYDKTRGKINLQQSLTERIAAVRETGLADMIIVEEYEGQKIDDIQRYDIDIFTVGSDWEGKFDYLGDYCQVIYLPRTEGVSSSELRSKKQEVKIGFIGDNESRVLHKYCRECKYVNGALLAGICSNDDDIREAYSDVPMVSSYDELLPLCDAVYILSHPSRHYEHIRKALEQKKHVLVELPVTLDPDECRELYELAKEQHTVLMPAVKTAYSTAYNRLLLLTKTGKIGKIVSVNATCTSIRDVAKENKNYDDVWNSICAWGPTALLPVLQILGTEYKSSEISSFFLDRDKRYDAYTNIRFLYDSAVASVEVGRGVKSEGQLVISGTEGYIYVPAPWWKTDYFEVRYESPEDNKRYFYQLDGEGIRYEIVAFLKTIAAGKKQSYISEDTALEITKILSKFYSGDVQELV